MLAKSFVALATLALASAGPVQRRQCSNKPTAPTLPVNGNGLELPAPADNLVLKHIALGHGIQNYTCTSVNGSTSLTANPTGALAALYDATAFYPSQGAADAIPLDAFNGLPTNAVWASKLPLTSDGSTKFGASSSAPFPSPGEDLALPGLKALPYLGVHFFDAKGTPTFKVGGDGGDIFSGGKLNGTKAPASADVGPEKTGAVDWLLLGDKNGASKGVTVIYRVVTAGGVAHQCTTLGATDSVPYATYYWMYGPKA
ncbi:malate dehydrogenase [Colletotrichum plurivorum]|uniref:Malate dehydrogenase n=1 Tax=Colletotrichum plurivorum TaxID=2175906 RepID=A0A8H6K9E2_9PEZI|nr:malate dehydrogenase [Colletotrichum plurivorum]